MKTRLDRRRWLRSVVHGTAAGLAARLAAPALLATAGCGGDSESEDESAATTDPTLRVAVDEIPAEGRLEREHMGVPVEFRRENGEIVAISMLCSHQMCHIEWQPEERRYHCPCHEGLFDEDGNVVYGPPKRPLRRLTVSHDGDAVAVDVNEVYRAVAPSAD